MDELIAALKEQTQAINALVESNCGKRLCFWCWNKHGCTVKKWGGG